MCVYGPSGMSMYTSRSSYGPLGSAARSAAMLRPESSFGPGCGTRMRSSNVGTRSMTLRLTGNRDDQRHAHEGLPDLEAVLERDPVLVHRLAVVARDGDDRVLSPYLAPDVIEQPADGRVGEPHLAVVRRAHLVAGGLGGIGEVRCARVGHVLQVRVEIVDPQEEPRRGRARVEQLDRRVGELRARRVGVGVG